MNALRLWLGLSFLRHGALHGIALLLLAVAAFVHGWALPRMESRVAAQEARLRALSSPAPARSAADDLSRSMAAGLELRRNHDGFLAVLYDERQVPGLIAGIFAHAGRGDLVLAQAEYRRHGDPGQGFGTVEMRLPVTGRYMDLRRFIDATLQGMPGLALREASFRRETVGAGVVDAQLAFVFHVKVGAR